MKDYRTVRKNVDRQLQSIKPASVYLDGTLKAPGFSDLDYVIICDRVDEQLMNAFMESGDPIQEYIIFHSPLFMDESLARDFGRVMGNEDYHWAFVSGKKVSLSKGSRKDVDFRRWDDIVFHEIRNIYRLWLSKKISVRKTLNKLYAMRFQWPKWLLQTFPADTRKRLKIFIQDVDKLRNEWFKQNKDKNLKTLIELIDRAVKICDETMPLYAKYLERYLTKKPGKGLFFDIKVPTLFKDAKNYSALMSNYHRKTGRLVFVCPQAFAGVLTAYRTRKSPMAIKIRKRLSYTKCYLKKEYLPIISKRLDYYERSCEFNVRNGVDRDQLIVFDEYDGMGYLKRIKRLVRRYIFLQRIKRIV